MKRLGTWWMGAALAAAVLVAGCIETKQDVTLNPDRSGKARIELIMADMPFTMTPDQEPPDPQVQARQFAKRVLEGSRGVEAWADVSFGRTEEGRNRFVGTAYFKDFLAMKLQTGKTEGLTITRTEDGGMLLRLEPGEKDEGKEGSASDKPARPEKPAPPPLSEEQLQQRIQAERAKWQQMKPMMAMTIGRMKMDLVFRLPGTLVEVKGFQRTPDGAVRFTFDGAKMLAAVDKLMADDAYVRQQLEKQQDASPLSGPQMDERTMKELFGTAGPFIARTKGPAGPQFDYAAEVEAAKMAYPAMIKRLGLDQVPPPRKGPVLPPGFAEPPSPPEAAQPGGGTGGR